MTELWVKDKNLRLVMNKLSGKFEVREKIGGGGYSDVYKVFHKYMEEESALKIMDSDYILKNIMQMEEDSIREKYDRIKDRILKEAMLYHKLKHPNIVKIKDVAIVYDKDKRIEIPYMLMEYIRGITLKKRLEIQAPPGIDTVFKISKDILSALAYLHKNRVVHRDIKCGNIMIKEDTGDAVLIDFGLAKDPMNTETLTMTDDRIRGTIRYMSPEQIKTIKNLTSSTDIYSFGIVLYEMLTGKQPFDGKDWQVIKQHLYDDVPNVREINPQLPRGIEDVVFKATAKAPGDRYQSAEEFLEALEAVKKGSTEQELEEKEALLLQEEEENRKAEEERQRREQEAEEARKIAEEERKLREEALRAMEEEKRVVRLNERRKTLFRNMFYFFGATAVVIISILFVIKPILEGTNKEKKLSNKYITDVEQYMQKGDLKNALQSLHQVRAWGDKISNENKYLTYINETYRLLLAGDLVNARIALEEARKINSNAPGLKELDERIKAYFNKSNNEQHIKAGNHETGKKNGNQ